MKNRTCLTCGTQYTFCPHCDYDKNKPGWYAKFHNENCKNIFNTLLSHYLKGIDDKEAQRQLSEYNLEMELYSKDMQKQIKDILKKQEEKVFTKTTYKKKKTKGQTI